MTESSEKQTAPPEGAENGSVSSPDASERVFVGRRAFYLEELQKLIELCSKKIRTRTMTDSKKLSWARQLVSACSAAGGIFRDLSLEEFNARLKLLEERLLEEKPRPGR